MFLCASFASINYPQGNSQARSATVPSSIACVKIWIEQRANGPKMFLGCSGPTGPPSVSWRAKRCSYWHMERKQSSRSILACRHFAWKRLIDIKMMHNSAWSCINQRKRDNKPRSVWQHTQQQIRAAHHKKVKIREFQSGYFILSRVIPTTAQKDQGKLGPNWEGLYTIIAWGGKGSYILADQDGKILEK